MALNAIDVGTDLAATTLTDLYTVVDPFEGCVLACNRTGAPIGIRIATAPAAAADDPSQYKVYDFALPANDQLQSPPLALPSGTVVRGYASAIGVTMAVNGLERP